MNVRPVTDEERADTEPPPSYADVEPRCHCPTATPWAERRWDGVWEQQTIEQRTCWDCGASLSRVVP